MEALYFFEKMRTPVLDRFFYLVTALGAEVFFIIIAISIYWCFSKKLGYYLMSVCFFGVAVNQILKLITRVPRPWVMDPDFTIVEMARKGAPGYSFPSGHTQNAVSIAGCFAMSIRDFTQSKKTVRNVWIACIAYGLVVAISRMYLGVHTSWDVGISCLMAVLFVVVFRYVFKNADRRPSIMYFIIAAMLLMSLAFLVIAYISMGTDAHDIENIISSRRHAWYMVGGVLGIAVAYPIERRFINFDTRATVAGHLLKAIPGVAIVFGIKMLEKPLLFIFGGSDIAHGVRYFMMVLFAIGIWPATFKYFARVGQKK